MSIAVLSSSSRCCFGGFKPLVGQGPPAVFVSSSLVSALCRVKFVSLLLVSKFQIELCNHLDRAEVDYVMEDVLSLVFGLVFLLCEYAVRDSAIIIMIDDYLETEIARVRIAGPFPTSPFPSLHISRFGVIP